MLLACYCARVRCPCNCHCVVCSVPPVYNSRDQHVLHHEQQHMLSYDSQPSHTPAAANASSSHSPSNTPCSDAFPVCARAPIHKGKQRTAISENQQSDGRTNQQQQIGAHGCMRPMHRQLRCCTAARFCATAAADIHTFQNHLNINRPTPLPPLTHPTQGLLLSRSFLAYMRSSALRASPGGKLLRSK